MFTLRVQYCCSPEPSLSILPPERLNCSSSLDKPTHLAQPDRSQQLVAAELTQLTTRAFKTLARTLFMDSDLNNVIDEECSALHSDQDAYIGEGSGFVLHCINGI